MTGLWSVRRLALVAVLVFAWCALWGEPTPANVLSGTVVAVAVLATGVGTDSRGGVRFGPLARFTGLVLMDLVVSTISVGREILRRNDGTTEAIVAVRVPTDTRRHLLLLIVAVTVTPGTAVVDADPDSGTLYLHVLHAERRAKTTAHVLELARLACAALPTRPPTRTITGNEV